MKLRKIIALLSAALLLLSLMPLSATVFAEENLMVNGDFETGNGDGWDVRSGSSIVSDVVHSGKYAIKSTNTNSQYQTMFTQKLSVKANTDYTISFWYYYDGSCADPCCYLYVMDGNKTVNVGSNKNAPAATKTWYQVTTTFNTGVYTTIMVYLKNETVGDGGTYYFDDFVLTGPDAEPEQPESDNLMVNGDFETGDGNGWDVRSGSSVVNDVVHGGNYAIKSTNTSTQYQTMFAQKLTVNANAEYTLSFWYYYDGSCATPCCNLYVMDGGKATNVGALQIKPDATKTWYPVTLTFNTDVYTSIWVYLKNETVGDGGTYYFDDFVLTGSEPEPIVPEGENLLENGDFELGNTSGWTTYQGTKATTAAAKSGQYGAHLTGNGGWGSMINQRFTTKKGFKYNLFFDMKVVSNGANIQVKDNATDEVLYSTWRTEDYWETVIIQFTATSDRTFLNFCGSGNGKAESVYVDNFWVVEIPCTHEYDDIQDTDCNICGEAREIEVHNIISGGLSSASADVKGLGFKFEIDGVGAAVDGNNKYIADSATIKPLGETEYKLTRMGAIMSNKADAKLKLGCVNSKDIINVEAVYLLESDEDSLAFSTRVVNIPESGEDTTIYACPYFVFEKDGEAVVMYGATFSQNYATAIGA